MKKKFVIIMVILSLVIPNIVTAAPTDFAGGVNNEYSYEEVVFITGEPIKFIGSFTVSESEKDTSKTVSYKFDLKLDPKDKKNYEKYGGDKARYDKKITYVTSLKNYDSKGQTIGDTTVTKYSEKLRISSDSGEDVYDLEDYQFSKSDVSDNTPASDFYSGNIKGRKYYMINKKGKASDGQVIVDITGGNVGYENFWGNTETQVMDYIISSNRTEPKKKEWTGSVNIQTSDSLTKSLRYSENDANYSSFDGGYAKVTNSQMVSKYQYSLPKIKDGEIQKKSTNTGTIQLNQSMTPKLERLIIPKFRDVNGHWAEDSIKKLYSLDVFDDNSTIFSPDTHATKLDFTKAIIRACDIRVPLDEKKRTSRRTNDPPEKSYFTDIELKDPNYVYAKSAVDKGIIQGVQTGIVIEEKVPVSKKKNATEEIITHIKSKFVDEEKPWLTRGEAITILIRALGFENKAPNPGYRTSFSDDREIPNWAKDSIYMAKELNLVQGDNSNRVNANKVLTRAEASTLVVRFLEFLEKDLQKDYRENIINFK